MRIREAALGLAAVFCTAFAATSASAASATACVSTFFGEQSGNSSCETETAPAQPNGFVDVGASVNLSDGFDGASAKGVGGAFVSFQRVVTPDADETFQHMSLHAFATGSQTTDGDGNFVSAGATVGVSVSDHLYYSDPLVANDSEFSFFNPFIHILMRLDGSISNKQGASFSATVATAGGAHTYSVEGDVNGPTRFGQILDLSLPGDALLTSCNRFEPCDDDPLFTLGLSLSGGTDRDNNDGSSDFSNTFKLLAVYFGDANGNPTSGNDLVQIVGSQGAALPGYSNLFSPTPEPGVWALALLGFGAMGAALRRRAVLKAAA